MPRELLAQQPDANYASLLWARPTTLSEVPFRGGKRFPCFPFGGIHGDKKLGKQLGNTIENGRYLRPYPYFCAGLGGRGKNKIPIAELFHEVSEDFPRVALTL